MPEDAALAPADIETRADSVKPAPHPYPIMRVREVCDGCGRKKRLIDGGCNKPGHYEGPTYEDICGLCRECWNALAAELQSQRKIACAAGYIGPPEGIAAAAAAYRPIFEENARGDARRTKVRAEEEAKRREEAARKATPYERRDAPPASERQHSDAHAEGRAARGNGVDGVGEDICPYSASPKAWQRTRERRAAWIEGFQTGDIEAAAGAAFRRAKPGDKPDNPYPKNSGEYHRWQDEWDRQIQQWTARGLLKPGMIGFAREWGWPHAMDVARSMGSDAWDYVGEAREKRAREKRAREKRARDAASAACPLQG